MQMSFKRRTSEDDDDDSLRRWQLSLRSDRKTTEIFQAGQTDKKKKKRHKRQKTHRWWIHPIYLQRDKLGNFCTLFQELKNDPKLIF